MARKLKKKPKKSGVPGRSSPRPKRAEIDYLSKLSDELLCHVLSFLPLREILCLSMLSHRLRHAVMLHLRLRKVIDFTEGRMFAYMPLGITDDVFSRLLTTCAKVERVYGLHPWHIEKRRQRTKKSLSIPGVIEVLGNCEHLKGVETSELKLMGAVLHNMPRVNIIGHFRNRDGQFPIPPDSQLSLPAFPQLSSLHLTGVELTELPQMLQLEFLYLQWVRFSKQKPFENFTSPKLHTFVMKHCAGPNSAAKYLPLLNALAGASKLKHVELIRVPFLGGLVQRVLESSWRNGAFRQLESIITGACRQLLENDLGYLILTCSQTLENVKIQPSLTKDSVFVALQHVAETDFSKLCSLSLGFVDDFPAKGSWTNDELVVEGLADVVELPCSVTDVGLKKVNELFPKLESLVVNWCPHLLQPTTWGSVGGCPWSCLRDLVLKRCHCLQLEDFVVFLSALPMIECVVLEDMFREPPRGCSHVGLSAGCGGLGMSSSIISQNQLGLGGNEANQNNIVIPDAVDPVPLAAVDPVVDGNSPNHQDENNEHSHCVNSIAPNPGEELGLSGSPCVQCSCASSTCQISSSNKRTTNGTVGSSQTSEAVSGTSKLAPCEITPDCCTCNCHFKSQNNSDSENNSVSRVSQFDKPGTSGLRPGDTACSSNKKSSSSSTSRFIDQGCQASIEDIRQATKNVTTAGPATPILPDVVPPGSTASPLPPSASTSGMTTRSKTGANKNNNGKCKRKFVRKRNVCDAATSTSDPVFQEDPVLPIKLVSDTLTSITLVACGISDLEVNHCPKLEHIEVDSCAIFKRVKLKSALNLTQLNISQCPRADHLQIVQEVKKLPARRNRMITIRLTQDECNAVRLGKVLLEDNLCGYHTCILEDHCPTEDERAGNRQTLNLWYKLIHEVNYTLMKMGFVQGKKASKPVASYPWGKEIHWLDMSCGDGDYSLCTDVPWLRGLWQHPAETYGRFYDVYDPQNLGCRNKESCFKYYRQHFSELQETDCILHLYTLGVYIHTGAMYQTQEVNATD